MFGMVKDKSTKLFIFGAGYAATATAAAMQNAGLKHIAGTTREPDKLAALKAAGITPYLFDGAPDDKVIAELRRATHLLISIGPNKLGDPTLKHFEGAIRSTQKLKWIGYLSTVGVYGDFGGAWINENTFPMPVSDRGKWRVEAEQEWQELAAGISIPCAIFRLAGIYGPGRSTFDKLRKGTSRRIDKKGQVFNRIHVDDIARIVGTAMHRKLGGIFNGADDEPTPPQIVIEHAAKMLGVKPPPLLDFETAEMTPMARSFYGDNKRVGNARIKKDLGLSLLYPTYREGLKMILDLENSKS